MLPHASTTPPPVTRHAAMTVVVVVDELVEVEVLLDVDVLVEVEVLVLVEVEVEVLEDVVDDVEQVVKQSPGPAGLSGVPAVAAKSQNSLSFLIPSPQNVQMQFGSKPPCPSEQSVDDAERHVPCPAGAPAGNTCPLKSHVSSGTLLTESPSMMPSPQ